jgi:hypothetical protein
MLIPVIVSAVGTIPVYVARFSDDSADISRAVLGVLLFVALVVVWVRRRDPWGAKVRAFFEEGRAATS